MSTEQTRAGSLTAAQIEFYETEGYLVLPHLLSAADLAPAQEAMELKVSQIADELLAAGLITDKLEDAPFRYRLAWLFANLSDQDFLKYGRSWRDRLPGYYDLMMNPLILDAVESLIGGELFANPVYNARPKVPKVAAGAVPWHQDKSYWPGANANPVITVWIPLVDSNLENGCLHLMPRTHTRRLLSYHSEQITTTGYLEIDAEHLAPPARVVALPLEAGGALLFNDRCVHMSTANNSDHVRWSVDLRYQPTDQDPMTKHGMGFLARSRQHPERVATRADWIAERMEHAPALAE
jgi:ectoine hydroxylase-related dioxygenase (phytanoyl-CoA dioxygenase family)